MVKFYEVADAEGNKIEQVGTGDATDAEDQRDLVFNVRKDPFSEVADRIKSRCVVCGRTLTNPNSIERGMGPVCFRKQGIGKYKGTARLI